ncbi:L,D-transpeptidase family protein [Methylocystis sp. 9N]|uniref:L,D-transpeptidase family protein n=1 Tax=Methylocystis borbori TaxID=3118750 RepID=A0ABU7XHT8_9HYPH
MFRRVSLQAAPLAIAAAMLAASAVAEPWGAGQEAPATPSLTGLRAAPTLMGETAEWPQAEAPISIDARRAVEAAVREWTNKETRAEGRARRMDIAAYYAQHDYAPLWREGADFSPAAKSALQTLHESARDGLRVEAPDKETRWSVAADLALSEAIADYAAQAGGARVDPAKISRLIGARPAPATPVQALDAVIGAAGDAGARLAAFNPPHAGYVALRDKLAELRAARANAGRVAAAAQTSDATPRANFATLSEGESKRVEAEIVANMERWRWIPRELGDTRVEVNIPQFELMLTRDGKLSHETRVVVGKTATPTPIFSDEMQFVAINPSWSVPQSIINKEMAPKGGGDLSYLAGRGYQVSYRDGRASVRQPPGDKNALGRVKFVFPNDFAVYMHDTPSKSFFANAKRAYSHGCVRVDQPFKLAETVLGADYGEKRLRGMVGPAERRINLSQPMPVHIEYFTAVVDANGALKLYDDVYGYSAKVRAALAL